MSYNDDIIIGSCDDYDVNDEVLDYNEILFDGAENDIDNFDDF